MCKFWRLSEVAPKGLVDFDDYIFVCCKACDTSRLSYRLCMCSLSLLSYVGGFIHKYNFRVHYNFLVCVWIYMSLQLASLIRQSIPTESILCMDTDAFHKSGPSQFWGAGLFYILMDKKQ